LLCSQCEESVDLLCKLPISGLNDSQRPWIGLCKACVKRLYDGFSVAKVKTS